MDGIIDSFSKSEVKISYLGKHNDQITSHLIDLAERVISDVNARRTLSTRIPMLIAESFQNIVRHGVDVDNQNTEKDFFQITFLPDRIIISTKNKIALKDIALLDQQIDEINSMSPDELKKLWRKTIQEGEFSKKGGAGIGIIEMARKSKSPLKKEFVPINDTEALFFLGIEINMEAHDHSHELKISNVVKEYNQLIEHGIILHFKGQFYEEMNSSLIEMLHINFIDEELINSNNSENLTILVELIQNASKHGMSFSGKSDGVFTLFEEKSDLYVRIGNYVKAKASARLNKRLERIKKSSIAELKEEHKSKLINQALSEEGDADLGLLEIAIFTENQFVYSIEQTSAHAYFFTIKLKLRKHG